MHYWKGVGADGKPRDITKPTLEPPLGSGPYAVKALQPGDWIAFERLPNYWGRDLPVRRGQHNFDAVEFRYFGDVSVALEAFKANQYDFRLENSAKNWATAYEFPALSEGKVVKKLIKIERPQWMQGFGFNLRKLKFQDLRVRRAFNLAFDFEWSNQNLFFGQYNRMSSYFEGQELAAKGLPSAAELALLEPLRDTIPPEVFTEEYKNPINVNPSDFRAHLREAAQLLKEAGYTVVDSKLRDVYGTQLTVEFLINEGAILRVIMPYAENLKRLGIDVSLRQVDSAEMRRREDSFDFDITFVAIPQSRSPRSEQRAYWGSAAADVSGGRNIMGVKNAAVDVLVEKIILAQNRDAQVAACRALSRVLIWNTYLIPTYYMVQERAAYWNKFGMPDPLPKIAIGFPDVWWYDAKLALKNGLK